MYKNGNFIRSLSSVPKEGITLNPYSIAIVSILCSVVFQVISSFHLKNIQQLLFKLTNRNIKGPQE